jgi:L-ascorbate metabolism protein UlaG (beta-lactamase superfamily)
MRVRELPVRRLGPRPRTAPARLTLSWLGQAGWLLEQGGRRVVVDPYLSDSLAAKYAGTRFPHERLAAAPVAPAELDVDLVLCSHRHTDHMDPDTLRPLAEGSAARFVVPAAWVERVAAFGIPPERIVGAVEHRSIAEAGLTIRPVLAAHERIERDAEGRSLFLGYVVDIGGLRVYHSGDCAPYPGQSESVGPIDVAILPVNGRDHERLSNGVPGNFHPEEAVALAGSSGARLFVASHFGMFAFNTVDQDRLDAAVAGLPRGVPWLQPEIGRSYEVDDDD